MMLREGDDVRVRDLGIGSQNMRVPTVPVLCTVCGCDCSDFCFEAYAFTGVPGASEYVLIRTCMAHFAAPLAARLRAAGRR
jgi:hypothetical protein